MIDRELLYYSYALDQMVTRVEVFQKEFLRDRACNPIEHIKSRLKSKESVLEKCERKGIKPTPENLREHVRDIAGIRVICSFKGDIYRLAGVFVQQQDLKVIEYKDYIENPKPNGYQSLHLILETPVYLTDHIRRVPVEIQIRTVAMDFWASLEHKIYYKQHMRQVPFYIRDDLKKAADAVAKLDEKMEEIHEYMEKHKFFAS